MQGLVVVGFIVQKIWNVDVNCVKVSRALNIGQGTCQVRTSGRCFVQPLNGCLVL